MAKIPEGKFECTGCKGIFSEEETDDEGEDAKDWNGLLYCDECDSDQENPYCQDCAVYFENTEMTYCKECLDEAFNDTPKLKGYVVEKIVEKVVEKPVYIKEGSAVPGEAPKTETMEEFERRIMGT